MYIYSQSILYLVMYTGPMIEHQKTYEYRPFLEVSQQLCSTPQSRDTQTTHSVCCYCWQDKGGRSHSMLGTSQGHNLHWWEDVNKSERKD